MSITMSCSPGWNAAAGLTRATEQLPALVLRLDPVTMTIHLPPHPGGGALLARFCRDLAREATRLADLVDPARVPIYAARQASGGGGSDGDGRI